MSKNFEVVVRPFQLNQVTPPQRYVTPNQQPSPPVILNWGRGGRGKSMGGNVSMVKTFYLDQHIVEKSS